MIVPADTVCPISTASPVTVPSLCAVSGCSIFIASSTTTVSPADTCCPSSATILMIVPCIGLVSASPPDPAARERPGRCRDAARSAGPARLPAAPAAAPSPAGSTTSSRRVTLSFEILRDGTVRNVRVLESSGDAQVDYAAQRAVLKSSPVRRLPEEFERNTANVEFWFQLQR